MASSWWENRDPLYCRSDEHLLRSLPGKVDEQEVLSVSQLGKNILAKRTKALPLDGDVRVKAHSFKAIGYVPSNPWLC